MIGEKRAKVIVLITTRNACHLLLFGVCASRAEIETESVDLIRKTLI
jgi:hypothetical protein